MVVCESVIVVVEAVEDVDAVKGGEVEAEVSLEVLLEVSFELEGECAVW